MRTTLTVAEIGYFLKMLVACEIVQARRKISKIMRLISIYIATDNVDAISLQSLHNKYYKAEGKTMETIKTRLLKMIEFIDKDIDLVDR